MEKHGLRYRVLTFTVIFVIVAVMPLPVDAQSIPYENAFKQGPYVDKILFKFGDTDKVLSFLNNEIDMHIQRILPQQARQLREAENIEVHGWRRNGYGVFTVNCAKYPLNITALRRAFAFAYDKRIVCQECWSGEAEPQDTPLPYVNPYSIEGQLPYSYYDPNPEIGNRLLDAAGFFDVNADGWREAPDGSSFEITIEHGVSNSWDDSPAPRICEFAVNAFRELGIRAKSQGLFLYDLLGIVNHHLDFDMVFFGWNFGGYDFEWMANYRSELADMDFMNEPQFSNATFDVWCNQILYPETEDDILEAGVEMQKIIAYECPRIPVYCDFRYQAYRTDVFENYYLHEYGGVANRVSFRKVHRRLDAGGPWGGVLRVGIWEIETLNQLKAGTTSEQIILSCLLEPLMEDGMNEIAYGGLAESGYVEFHVDNPDVPRGHTRITYKIVRNATWSDGVPITAEDLAFSINYYRDSVAYGNPRGIQLKDLTAAYAANPYTVIAEYDTVSISHFEIVNDYGMLPKHLFEEIGLEGWYTWNPIIGYDTFIGSGPFIPGQYVPGEFLELIARPDWVYGIPRPSSPTNTETTTPPPQTNEGYELERLSLIVLAGVTGAAVVILPGRFMLEKARRKSID